MKRIIYTLMLVSMAGGSIAAQEFDDIYYNPNKSASSTAKAKKQSNYIRDFQNIDVDEYNRRGQYYESPVDTIGASAQNDEDFVYTQKIQKFYNPTIVVDNADVLADVLQNAYGNVDIVFSGGIPYFNSIYGWPGYYNYYNWATPYWTWGPSWSWSWGPSWAWSWNWGPSWGWGPSWAWGPSWSWGPSWGWSSGWGRPYYGEYRPNGRVPNRPGSNWATNTRPGGNYRGPGMSTGNRYGSTVSPASGGTTTMRPAGGYNYHRTTQTGTVRNPYAVGSTRIPANNSQSSHTVNSQVVQHSNSHRNSTVTTNPGTTHYNNSSTTTNTNSYKSSNSYNTNRSSSSNRSYGGSSYGGGRSSGGSYGGGRSSGGSHGGGSRGTRR